MRWIIGSSLKLRRLVVALAVGVVALGLLQIDKTPIDSLPEYQPPTVEVQTEALGLSAAEVEQLITVPLEQDLLVGVPFLDEIESVSLPGLSSVVMTFEPGTDVLDARQVVQERLTQAVGVAGLPAVAKPPQMIQPLSSNSRVSMLKLTSDELTPIEMSVLARWVIGPRLLGVPGVANVAIWGNRERQLQVLVDPDRLLENGVALSEVVRTAGNALEVSPLSYLEASKPGTGGFIDTPNQRLNIFHEQTISSPEDLAQVPVEGADGASVGGRGGALTLGDVTEVVENHQPLIGDAACGGGEQCLLLVVEKFPNANTAQVTNDVDAAVAALRPGLADMRIDSSVYRPGAYIEATWENLEFALTAGAILGLLVLLALFWDWRRAVVVASAVVVSMATAILVLGALDATVNLLVLAGLVLGATAMVDDAVTDTDGLARRIRHHRETGTSAPVWATVVEGSANLRKFALYGAFMVAAAALPLFFLRDEGGAFLPPIALAYLLAVAASMAVALTVTPVLALMLLGSPKAALRDSPLVRRLHRGYDRSGPRLVTRTWPAVAVFVGITVLGLAALPFLTPSLAPHLKEREVLVHLETAPGTSLPKMTGVTARAVDDIAALPGIEDVNAHIGRAIMSDQRVGVNEGEVWFTVAPSADYDATVASVAEQVSSYPGVRADVMTYTDARVSQVLGGDERDVAVRVYGENPDVLTAKAGELRAAIADVEGVSRVGIEPTPEESTIEVEVDLERAQELGVKPGDVRRAAAILLGSITVGNLFEEQKVFDVVVWGAPQVRTSLRDVEQLRIDTPAGDTIRLGDVAEVREVPNAAVIRHESVARYVELSADVAGRPVADVNDEVKALVSGTEFPLDHHAEVLGGYAERRASLWQVTGVALAAVVLVYLLFQAAFRSWRLAALALVMLPVAGVGTLLATLVTDGLVTLGVLTGAIAVLGFACRAILLSVGHLLRLERREEHEFGPELVVRGTRERLLPLLGSALGSAALLLPIALAAGATGFEILRPAAIAFLGGLVTTSVVVLFVLPALHLRLGSVPDPDSWIDDLYEPGEELETART